ncbi:MAG: hypothetical protein R3C16_09435 [Hyphomonadaceae bacterium]
MAQKIEFASDEWLSTLKGLIERYMTLAPGAEISICEVFTGVPKHLDKNGDGVIAWHCRIKDGRLEFKEGEIDDADLKTVADYDFVLQLARMRIEPGTMEKYEALSAEGTRSGKLNSQGDRTKVPQAFYGMHNDLADITQ